MSIRSLITTIAVAAALLAFPVVASARLTDVGPLDVHAKTQPAVPAPSAQPAPAGDHGGIGTVTIVFIASGALLGAGVAVVGGSKAVRGRAGALGA